MLTSKSKFEFQGIVDEIVVEKQECCSPQEGLVDHPDIHQGEAWGKLLCENLGSHC